MTEKNVELAYQVLDLTQEHEQHFDMSMWLCTADLARRVGSEYDESIVGLDELKTECGTTACFAGWAVAAAGYQMDEAGYVYDADGKTVSGSGIANFARKLLGISEDEADHLFHVTDYEICEAVQRVFGRRPSSEVA